MLVEFPDDLSTLISKAQGSLTLKAFAEKAGISYSKLHRLAKHEIKRSVDDETLKAIADHAAPESGVTLEALREACDFVVESNKTYEDEQKELYLRRKNAISEIQDSILHDRFVESVSCRISHPHGKDLSNPAAAPFFDLSAKVKYDVPGRPDADIKGEEFLYFHVSDNPLGWDTLDDLESFIGRIILRGQPQKDERYYLVVINDQKKKGNEYKIDRIKDFEEICRSLQPAFVVVGEMDEREAETQNRLLSTVFPDREGELTIDTRIREYVINASVVIVTYDDEDEEPYLTDITISNPDHILYLGDGTDIPYVFSEEYKEGNVWVAPYVRVYHDVEKGEENNHEE